MSYGVDVWCADKYVSGRKASGVTLVAQALYRRLITARGTLRGGDEESAYGIDLSSYVGAVGTATALAALPGIVRGELMKDDRVTDVVVSATIAESVDRLVTITLVIDVVLADEDETFTLTLSVSEAAVTLIGVA